MRHETIIAWDPFSRCKFVDLNDGVNKSLWRLLWRVVSRSPGDWVPQELPRNDEWRS
jgi:hypothetical protein